MDNQNKRKSPSDETKQKIREAQLRLDRSNRQPMQFTEEAKEKMRQAKLGKKRQPFSEEHKAAMKEAQRERRAAERTARLKDIDF